MGSMAPVKDQEKKKCSEEHKVVCLMDCQGLCKNNNADTDKQSSMFIQQDTCTTVKPLSDKL